MESEFDVPSIGDGAVGMVYHVQLEATDESEAGEWYVTEVVFMSGRVIGFATIGHDLDTDHTALATDLADRLEQRLEDVRQGAFCPRVFDGLRVPLPLPLLGGGWVCGADSKVARMVTLSRGL